MATLMPRRPARSDSGFTLVEMMVALTLGLMLALVVAQLFANTRATNRSTEDSARLQENARYAAAVIGRVVRMAGYKSDPAASSTSIFPEFVAPALTGIDGTGLLPSDTLVVRFQGSGSPAGIADNTVLDCVGVPVAPDFAGTTKSYNNFFIATGADGRNALWCDTDPAGLDLTKRAELVPGVDAMQVLFGEDRDGDGSADRFLPPGTPGLNIDSVVVVRVYLLMAGSENVRVSGGSVSFTMAGQAYTYNDQKIRRVVTTTITLRNRAP